MGHRGNMNQILMVKKLVLFRRHHVPVEAEQLSERLSVVHLHRLIRRPEALEFARGTDEEAAVRGQVFRQDAWLQISRRHFIGHRVLRDESPGI
jgi:hypothetical protein